MRQCWCLPKKRCQRHFTARIPGGYGGKAKEYVTGRIINLSSIVGQGRQHRSDELGGVQVWPARVDHEHGAGGRLPAQTLPASSACIATEMVRAIPDKIRDNFCDKIPINGFGEPEEIGPRRAFPGRGRVVVLTSQVGASRMDM